MIIRVLKKTIAFYLLLSLFTWGNSSEAQSLRNYKVSTGAKYTLSIEDNEAEVNITTSHSLQRARVNTF